MMAPNRRYELSTEFRTPSSFLTPHFDRPEPRHKPRDSPYTNCYEQPSCRCHHTLHRTMGQDTKGEFLYASEPGGATTLLRGSCSPGTMP